mgnify:CR=1 FL=1
MELLKHISHKAMGAAYVGALVVSAPVALLAPTAPAMAQSSDVLNQAVRALRAITTLKADVTQTDRNGQSLEGELAWRNPGNIRFDYTEENMLVVSNGRTLSFVDYDVQQEQRWPIRNSPLGALLDPDRDLTQYGRVVPTNSPNVISIAVEDPERPEFPQITLIFVRKSSAPGGLELASWVSLDSQNTRTTIRLRNHRYGEAIPDSTFSYRRPGGSSRRPR